MSANDYADLGLPGLPEAIADRKSRKRDRWSKVQRTTRPESVKPLLPPMPYDEEFWARYRKQAFQQVIPVAQLTEAAARDIFIQTLEAVHKASNEGAGDDQDNIDRTFQTLYGILFERSTVTPPDKADVLRELEQLIGCARRIRHILKSSGSDRERSEHEARLALMNSMYRNYRGAIPITHQMTALAEELEHLEQHCRQATDAVSSFRPKRGLAWYEEFTFLMLHVAADLGVKVTTAGNRTSDPYRTAFTTLVFGLQGLLREDVQSKTLMGCARRIERTQTYREFHDS